MVAVLAAEGMESMRHLESERGSMLIELLVAMAFLAIAIGALVSVYVSTARSLQNTGIEGTATSLVDRQIELYNTLQYTSISLDSATIPTGGDLYVTAHSSDPTIPSSSGQVTGATTSSGSCTSPTSPQAACATQTLTGADGQSYRVDTYILSVMPPTEGSRAVKQVTVAARLIRNGVIGPIRARGQSAFDACNPPTATAGAGC